VTKGKGGGFVFLNKELDTVPYDAVIGMGLLLSIQSSSESMDNVDIVDNVDVPPQGMVVLFLE
jgi:hypothetical protein